MGQGGLRGSVPAWGATHKGITVDGPGATTWAGRDVPSCTPAGMGECRAQVADLTRPGGDRKPRWRSGSDLGSGLQGAEGGGRLSVPKGAGPLQISGKC